MSWVRVVLLLVVSALVPFGVLCVAQSDHSGLSEPECAAVLSQIDSEAPIVYLQYLADLLRGRDAIVIGTTLYRADDGRVHSAKLSVFAKTDTGWALFHETDMDARVVAQGLTGNWEISLARVEAVDLDGDAVRELVVWWGSEPQTGFSLVQYSHIVHVLRYDSELGTLCEITGDKIVYSRYTERAMLLNVDRDDVEEIVVLNEIWEPDTCVECPKRFRIDVMTVSDGKLVRDPAWNGGEQLQTTQQYSLLDCNQGWSSSPSQCDLGELLRLTLACVAQKP